MRTRLRRKWGTLFHIFADSSLGEEFEELELAKSAKAEHGVLGGRNLLDLSFAGRRFARQVRLLLFCASIIH